MATHPDDPNVPQPGDEQQPGAAPAKPGEGAQGKASKHTKLPRQPGKPTMIQHGEEDESKPAPVPNMSLEESAEEIMALEPVTDETELIPPDALPAADEDIPVLEEVPEGEATEALAAPSDVAEAQPVSEVAEVQPVSDVAEAEAVFEEMQAEPISDVVEALPASDVASKRPADVTGADMPGIEVTGAEHVLGDDMGTPHPVEAAGAGSDVLAALEPASGAEAVLGEEPLERGSRPSARVESPIRAEPDDDAVDLGGPPPVGKKTAKADLDATEEVLAVESGERGSSAINWNEIGADSGAAAAQPIVDETVPYDISGEGSSHDSLLNAEDLAKHADDSSAVNLGDLPSKSKSPSGIDAVAEALESGVNLDDEVPLSPTPGAASVEFDDILTDSSESLPPVKKGTPKKGAGDEELETLAPTDDDIEAVDRYKKKKKKTSADVEDEAAAPFTDGGDDAEAIAVPAEDEAEAVAVPADEDEAVAAPVADEDTDEVAAPKGKGADADDEPPARGRGKAKGKPEPVPAGGPSCLGRLIGAGAFALLGVIVAVGAVAGIAFVSPDIMEQVPSSPWVVKRPAPPPKVVQLSPAQRAYDAIATGDYAGAIEQVKDVPDESAKAALGEARALKLLKDRDLSAKPLSKEEKAEIDGAIKDLRDGKNDTLAKQIELAMREPEMRAKAAQADQVMATAQKEVAQLRTDKKTLQQSLADATTNVELAAKELKAQQAVVTAVDKLLNGAGIKDAGPKGVAQLLEAKKGVEGQLGDVNKALADAKVKDPGAKGVQELIAAQTLLQKDRDSLNAAVKAAYDEMVQANVVKAGADPRQAIAEGAKKAREKGESPLALPLANLGSALAGLSQSAGGLAAKVADTSLLAAQLAEYKLREPFVQTPAQRFDLYAALLQDRNLSTPGELAAIQDEAREVLKPEAKATPALRAKAHLVTGLALRNEGKFDAARKELDSALKHAGAKGAGWQKQAQAALAELTDAQVYYLPQIARLQAAGSLDNALAQTDVALKALPGDGKLLAERARLRLEASRAKGKVSAATQAQIRGDAEAAIKSAGAAAEGEYALGLLDEDLGQFANAEKHYRAAIAAHKGSDEAAAQYRAALVRVLLMDRPAAAAPPAAEDDKGARREAPVQQPISMMHPVTALVLTAAIAAQPQEPEAETENPATAKRLREAIDLAKTLAASKDAKVREQGYGLLAEAAAKAGAQLTSTSCLELGKGLISQPDPKVRGTGLMLTGQALVKQGKRTEGLKEYARGLELLHPDLATREITRMVEQHPAFQQPDSVETPNPILAEKHYGNGLHLYWARRYPEAEAQFKQAVAYFNQDARYLYFLGLSQLAQKSKLKRDQAYYSFEQGARLEAQGRPSLADINTSLERVQGDIRQVLGTYRNRGATAAAE